jgi:hypothetical protein
MLRGEERFAQANEMVQWSEARPKRGKWVLWTFLCA